VEGREIENLIRLFESNGLRRQGVGGRDSRLRKRVNLERRWVNLRLCANDSGSGELRFGPGDGVSMGCKKMARVENLKV